MPYAAREMHISYPRPQVALLLLALGACAPYWSADAQPGAAVFARSCAVCHGPQGAGIPGSFPPLQGQIAAFAKIPEGREYLVMVVTTGLNGELPVAGITYHGVMPPQPALSEEDVAAVLNYMASALGKNKSAGHPFDAKEVAAIKARHPGGSGQSTRTLRPNLPDK